MRTRPSSPRPAPSTIGGVVVTVAGDVTLQRLAATINSAPRHRRHGHGGPHGSNLQARHHLVDDRFGACVHDREQPDGHRAVRRLPTTTAFPATPPRTTPCRRPMRRILTNQQHSGHVQLEHVRERGGRRHADRREEGSVIRGLRRRGHRQPIKDKLQTFVTAYNEFLKFAGEQRTAAGAGDAASIGREPILRQLHNSLRAALSGAHGTGVLTRLAEAGVEVKRNGELTLNEDVFDAAVTAAPTIFATLFSAGRRWRLPCRRIDAGHRSQVDGLIPSTKKRLQDQIASMNDQIEAMQRRLALQRETLQSSSRKRTHQVPAQEPGSHRCRASAADSDPSMPRCPRRRTTSARRSNRPRRWSSW